MTTLFPEADAYNGDPLHPNLKTPTPATIVTSLSRSDRQRRLQHLIDQSHGIYDSALETLLNGRQLIAECLLFSGGNDSTTLAHLFRNKATHAIHANTTIGIEETRQYVRDTCKQWGLPLIEEHAPDTYENLILGNTKTSKGEPVWTPGFPGPGSHNFMYTRLKERALDKARHTLGIANSNHKAATFIAGRRRQESNRRTNIPLSEADGTIIWISPIAMWTKPDLNTYRHTHPDLPHNEVSDRLHMSGECLCGAFAHPGELEEIRYHYPHVAAHIDTLQHKARTAGIPEPFCNWGHGQGKPKGPTGRLCSSCDARQLTFEDL